MSAYRVDLLRGILVCLDLAGLAWVVLLAVN